MNLKNVRSITVPEGTVQKITCNGVVLWESALLPSIYQQVAYIKAADNIGAYLDLGIRFDTSARFLIGMHVEEASIVYLFGAAEKSGAIRCMLTAPYTESGVISALYGTNTDYIYAVTSIRKGLNEFEGILKKGQLTLTNITIQDTKTLTTQSEYAMSSNLYLLGQNYNGSPRFGGTRRVSYFKYYDKTDTLICDLVPCYRKADGVIGMYDTVRKTFLTNAGTGSFTVGKNVSQTDGYTNMVPLSVEADGTPYNGGLGYKSGYRVRSGGAEAGLDVSSCTGFIPVKGLSVIRIAGCDLSDGVDSAINVADASFTNIGQVVGNSNYGIFISAYSAYNNKTMIQKDGYWQWVVPPDESGVKYIRVTGATADGSQLIVTVDEEIQ